MAKTSEKTGRKASAKIPQEDKVTKKSTHTSKNKKIESEPARKARKRTVDVLDSNGGDGAIPSPLAKGKNKAHEAVVKMKKASTEKNGIEGADNPKASKKIKVARGIDTTASKEVNGTKQEETAKNESMAVEASAEDTHQPIEKSTRSSLGSLVHSGMEAAARGLKTVQEKVLGLVSEDQAGVSKPAGSNVTSNLPDTTVDAPDTTSRKDNVQVKSTKRRSRDTSSHADRPRKSAKKSVESRPTARNDGLTKEKSSAEAGAEVGAGAEDDPDDTALGDFDQTDTLLKGLESTDEEGGVDVASDDGNEDGNDADQQAEGRANKDPRLPNAQKLKKQLKAAQSSTTEGQGPGVIYLGRVPHGFYEHQMREYFGQFGTISRIRLSRSPKTGRAKHYAFIEFESLAVAEIVAATMDNYLMFGHILKCKLVPAENRHESLWNGSNRRFKAVPWNKIEGRKLNQPASESKWKKRQLSEEKRRAAKLEKTRQIGYEFVVPPLKSVEDAVKILPEPVISMTAPADTADQDTSMQLSNEESNQNHAPQSRPSKAEKRRKVSK